MRFGLPILWAAAALALVAPPVAAQDDPAWSWNHVASPTGAFAVEVLCSDEELAVFAAVPFAAQGMSFDEGALVLCMHDGVLLVAGVVTADESDRESFPVFDGVAAGIAGQEPENVTISSDFVDGHRAMFSGETRDAMAARTAVIELAENQLLIVIAGGPMGEGVELDQMPAIMDHFFSSIEVLAQ